MKQSWIIIWIIVVISLWLGSMYNSLAASNESVEKAWWEVENQYQRRLDLIGNLVETVKGFADQELEVFTEVTQARAEASQTNIDLEDASDVAQFQESQSQLNSALSRLLVTVEAYPELKSDQNFLELQAQLEWTENRIATARNDFLTKLESYNTRVVTLPTMFIAKFFGFNKKEYFEANDGAENAPAVNFGG